MITYHLTFFLLFLLSIYWNRFDNGLRRTSIFSFVVFMIIFIALKYDVGTDSLNYLNYHKVVYYKINTLGEYDLDFPQISYTSLNLLSSLINGGMLFVYSISGIIIVVSLFKACSVSRVNPFLYMVLVFPSHFVMLSVSGIRQGVAGSLLVLSYAYILTGRKWLGLSIIIFATTFHSSAIIFVSLLVLDMKRKYIVILSPFIILTLIYFSLGIYGKYLDSDMSNAGLILRYGYFACIVIVIFFAKNTAVNEMAFIDKRHAYFFLAFLLSIGAVSFLSSTLADRLSYYLITTSTLFLLWLYMKYDIEYILSYSTKILILGSFITLVLFCFFGNHTINYTYDNYIYRYLVDGEFPKVDSRIRARGGYLPSSGEP